MLISLLMKLAWNVLNKKATWSKLVFIEYFKEDTSVKWTPCGWMIGNGSSIDFWKDVWVGNTSLASQSGLPLSAFKNSETRVSLFISGNPQTWCFPMVNSTLLNEFLRAASGIDLPHAPILDQGIWKHIISGCNSYWNALVWYKCIHPRVSLMSWKVANNAIVIDEKTRSIGIPLVSCCSLYGNSMETRDHLFVTCFFANIMWSWFSNLFGLPLPCDMSFEAFSKKWKRPRCHGRTKDLWIIGWSHIITKCIMKHISSITSNCRDFKAKSVRNDPFILEVVWLSPMSGRVKLNIDGCSKGNPGRSGFGGPIRMATNYLVELNAFIYGIEYAIRKCFTNV
ncbi:hypothetical protein AMTRI_Chr01g105440 [Amborella trichopoda]